MHERTNIQLSAADRNQLESVMSLTATARKSTLASEDCSSDGRRPWHCRNHAGHRQGQDGDLALAATVRRGRRGGLWRDKTRPSRIPPLSPEVAERVVALTLAGPPGTASYWTGAAMAKAAGVSVSSVQRVWRAHDLRPHLIRRFKLSNDPHHPTRTCGQGSTFERLIKATQDGHRDAVDRRLPCFAYALLRGG
jgi:hypothetical protein